MSRSNQVKLLHVQAPIIVWFLCFLEIIHKPLCTKSIKHSKILLAHNIPVSRWRTVNFKTVAKGKVKSQSQNGKHPPLWAAHAKDWYETTSLQLIFISMAFFVLLIIHLIIFRTIQMFQSIFRNCKKTLLTRCTIFTLYTHITRRCC